MKELLKCLWGGVLSTLTMLLLVLVVWASLTLVVVIVIVSSPVLFLLFVHWAYKTRSFIDFLKELITELEREKDDEED